MCDAPRVLLAAEVPCVGGAVPGDVTRVDVGVGWGDGGRSSRGALWGVDVVRGAVCFGVLRLWGLTLSHPPRSTEAPDRSTMVHPLRVMLGPLEDVGGVGPVCAALGSVGGPHLRVMVNVGVGVRGRCFPRVPLTPGVLSVSRGRPPGVLTSGGDRRTGCL